MSASFVSSLSRNAKEERAWVQVCVDAWLVKYEKTSVRFSAVAFGVVGGVCFPTKREGSGKACRGAPLDGWVAVFCSAIVSRGINAALSPQHVGDMYSSVYMVGLFGTEETADARCTGLMPCFLPCSMFLGQRA